MGKSSGGGQTQQASQTSTQLPPWLEGPASNAIDIAQSVAGRPYTPYPGEIVAGTTADSNQAYQQVRDMQGQTQPLYDQAAGAYQGLLGQATPQTAGQINELSNSLYGNYQQQVMDPARGLFGGYLQSGGPVTAQQVGANASALMSPYTQNVIDPALAAGEQARLLARQQVAGNAANVGAFGGSRQGISEGVADAQTALGTQKQIGDMLTTGWGQALTPAWNVAQLGSQQAFNAADTLSKLGQTGYANAGTQAGSIADRNLQAGLAAAQQLPGVATSEQKANQLDSSLLQTVGAAQQQQNQQQLSADIGQFYEGQDWPVQNLNILLGALGGVPYGTTGTSYSRGQQPGQTKNVAGGAMGGAASGAAIGALFGGVGAPIGAVAGGLLGALG